MATARRQQFSGTSTNGDFEEALQQAIAAAESGLGAELINWKLLNVYGVHGGFAGQNDLTAEIEATAP